MKKIYLVAEVDYDYNDEYFFEAGSIPVRAFTDKDAARKFKIEETYRKVVSLVSDEGKSFASNICDFCSWGEAPDKGLVEDVLGDAYELFKYDEYYRFICKEPEKLTPSIIEKILSAFQLSFFVIQEVELVD